MNDERQERQERRERTINIIRSMMGRTVENGCTPAEAAHASAKIQELLEKYQIDMVDIEKKTFDERLFRLKIDSNVKKQNPGDIAVLNSICSSYSCKLILTKSNNIVYNILGFESDVEAVKSVFLYVLENLDKRCKKESSSSNIHGIKFRNSYMYGAAVVISERLKNFFEERKQEYTKQGNALMVIKMNSLDKIKAPQVDMFVAEQFTKLTEGKASKSSLDFSAYAKGKIAGGEISLAKEIN